MGYLQLAANRLWGDRTARALERWGITLLSELGGRAGFPPEGVTLEDALVTKRWQNASFPSLYGTFSCLLPAMEGFLPSPFPGEEGGGADGWETGVLTLT